MVSNTTAGYSTNLEFIQARSVPARKILTPYTYSSEGVYPRVMFATIVTDSHKAWGRGQRRVCSGPQF